MTPSPPRPSSGNVQLSSPDRTLKPAGRSARDGHDLLQVAGGLLDPDDALVLGEAQQRLRADVGAGSAGHVVDDDRQAALIGDGAVVRLEHALVGLVVVRRHDQGGVRAESGRASGGGDAGAGVVRAGARHDVDPTGGSHLLDGRHRQLDDALAFGRVEGRRLAGRADGHEAVDASLDLAAQQAAQGGLVQPTVRRERRDERGVGAAQGRGGGGPGGEGRGRGRGHVGRLLSYRDGRRAAGGQWWMRCSRTSRWKSVIPVAVGWPCSQSAARSAPAT